MCVSLHVCIIVCVYHCMCVSLYVCIIVCVYHCMCVSLYVCATGCARVLIVTYRCDYADEQIQKHQ
jgi:hypothetical protein